MVRSPDEYVQGGGMKIYTKTGDEGETGLLGGVRVSKGNVRVEAYGCVDELNAHVGWALSQLPHVPEDVREHLKSVQSDLLTIGADLAMPPDVSGHVKEKISRLGTEPARRLEALIDRLDGEVRPLGHFILPGGVPGAAALQVCRAVCRRAERAVVRLAQVQDVNAEVVVYLNRLSDCFFVLSRWVNAREAGEEIVWEP